ncbi:signal recognition particle protein [Candidatus Woesearchaeota archaeon]|nr:signal recognition particle protein [Candidatus Woesearchaeota archaeon]
MLEKLGESLKETLKKIANAIFVDDTLLNELVKDLQRALLQADVNVKLVYELTQKIKERAKKEKPAGTLTQKEQIITIVYEELTKILGGEKTELKIEKKPTIIMLVGLYGSGKTTTIGKLAKYFKKRGKSIAVIGLDVHRPAAMKQLETVAEQAGVTAFVDNTQKSPVALIKQFKDSATEKDIVIVDTAGRDALSDELIKELKNVKEHLKPDYTILVISADIGQTAQKQAQAFHEACELSGVIVTKLDGTAKGGGALTACASTGAKVLFIGIGEKIDDLETYNPQGFVGRLLGMGDLEALLEKAQQAVTQEEAEDIQKRLLKGEFTLIDLYNQMNAMKKMGPLTKIVEMIPGFGQLQIPKEVLNVQQEKLEEWKHAMNSMTKKELEEPEIIDGERVQRITKGSGISEGTIRELIKQHRQGKKMMKMLKGGSNMEGMMKKLQRKVFKT